MLFYNILGFSYLNSLCINMKEVSTPILSFAIQKSFENSKFKDFTEEYYIQMEDFFKTNCLYLGKNI